MMVHRLGLRSLVIYTLVFGMVVAGCGKQTPTEVPAQGKDDPYRYGSLVGGKGGLDLFGGGRSRDDQAEQGGIIGVNSFLWRASLDTVAFMPIVSADPFGGVILTDWYAPPESPNERFKVQLYILDRQLRADGVRASVFRQVRDGSNWRDAPIAEDTATKLEDSILTRARQLRVAQKEG